MLFGLVRAHSDEHEQKVVSDIAILLYHPSGGTSGKGPRHAMVGSLPVLDLQARLAIGFLLVRSDHATAQSTNVLLRCGLHHRTIFGSTTGW